MNGILGEILLAVGWIVVSAVFWAMVIFGASIAWHAGKLMMDYQMAKWAFKHFKKECKCEDFQMENPNEERKNDKVPHKARKR